MKFKLELEMGNAAFDPDNGYETARILKDLASRIDLTQFTQPETGVLRDHNGNRVGTWEVTE